MTRKNRLDRSAKSRLRLARAMAATAFTGRMRARPRPAARPGTPTTTANSSSVPNGAGAAVQPWPPGHPHQTLVEPVVRRQLGRDGRQRLPARAMEKNAPPRMPSTSATPAWMAPACSAVCAVARRRTPRSRPRPERRPPRAGPHRAGCRTTPRGAASRSGPGTSSRRGPRAKLTRTLLATTCHGGTGAARMRGSVPSRRSSRRPSTPNWTVKNKKNVAMPAATWVLGSIPSAFWLASPSPSWKATTPPAGRSPTGVGGASELLVGEDRLADAVDGEGGRPADRLEDRGGDWGLRGRPGRRSACRRRTPRSPRRRRRPRRRPQRRPRRRKGRRSGCRRPRERPAGPPAAPVTPGPRRPRSRPGSARRRGRATANDSTVIRAAGSEDRQHQGRAVAQPGPQVAPEEGRMCMLSP